MPGPSTLTLMAPFTFQWSGTDQDNHVQSFQGVMTDISMAALKRPITPIQPVPHTW
jgi:hypothetical protein